MLTRIQYKIGLFRSLINPIISILFVGSLALCAFLIVWHILFGENPVANMMAKTIIEHTQLPNN